jgi:hypothetical protein
MRGLATAFGSPLWLDEVCWFAAAFKDGSRSSLWHRDGTGNALIELLDTAINQNGRELRAEPSARQALVGIAGILVTRNIPTALALQERIRNAALMREQPRRDAGFPPCTQGLQLAQCRLTGPDIMVMI